MSKINPYDYQFSSVNNPFRDWKNDPTCSPLLVLPTGSGKSLIIAMMIERIMRHNPNARIVVLMHVKELVEQNEQELLHWAPWLTLHTAVYSASAKRKEIGAVTYAQMQSAVNAIPAFGHVDLVIVDEAHAIPRRKSSQYQQVLQGFRTTNPNMKDCGLTATPGRLDGGHLCMGDNAQFSHISFEVPTSLLVERGQLVPVITCRTTHQMNLDHLHVNAGEFKKKDQEVECTDPEHLQNLVKETLAAAQGSCADGSDRKGYLVFGSTIAHVEALKDVFREAGVSCESITEKTKAGDRARYVQDYKNQQYKALISCQALTTGFNAKHADLLVLDRATQSLALYHQIIGRGMRINPDTGKTDCLLLDYGQNVLRMGPVDREIAPEEWGEPATRQMRKTKECPQCGKLDVLIHHKQCPDCGYIWEPQSQPKFVQSQAGDADVMMSAGKKLRTISANLRWHQSKAGNKCIRAEFLTEKGRVITYLLPNHQDYRIKGQAWAVLRKLGYSDLSMIGHHEPILPDSITTTTDARGFTRVFVS